MVGLDSISRSAVNSPRRSISSFPCSSVEIKKREGAADSSAATSSRSEGLERFAMSANETPGNELIQGSFRNPAILPA
jgi:hypothetical protein